MMIQVTDNLSLNRYQWADQILKEILAKEANQKGIVYDIGGRDAIMKDSVIQNNGNYFGFDLQPLSKDVLQWDIDYPFPYQLEKANLIVFLEVVEHLKNPWNSVKNIANSLKNGGYLILTTPNPHWSRSRIDLFTSGYLSCFTQDDLRLNHHVFTPWPHIVKKLMDDNGLQIKQYVTLDGKTDLFAKPITFKYPLVLPYRLINKAIEALDKRACGQSYGILAQKL